MIMRLVSLSEILLLSPLFNLQGEKTPFSSSYDLRTWWSVSFLSIGASRFFM